jgi:phage repressor protein C with HTH and peptisase S24 domain
LKNYSTQKERILQFIDYKGISKNKFYIQTGISNGTLDKKSKLSMDSVEKFYSTFPELNPEWILTGKEPMLKNNLLVNEPQDEYKITKDKGVPFYDVDFIAGELETFDNQTVVPEYYMDIPEFNGCTAFRAYSDSMEKIIKSGSILFGTKIENWFEHLEYGQIYGVISNDGRRYLKYIRKYVKDPDSYYTLRSENQDYDDFEIPRKNIRSIWLIHGWLNRRT